MDGGLSIQVKGKGNILYGSEGMVCSWNHGGARFSNGIILTQLAMLPLLLDLLSSLRTGRYLSQQVYWIILMIRATTCGPEEVFYCNDVRRRTFEINDSSDVGKRWLIIDPTCDEGMTYDDMEPQLVKEACEQNVALTGDSSWACKPSKVYPIIEVPGPNDFIPHPIDETTGQGRGGKHHHQMHSYRW